MGRSTNAYLYYGVDINDPEDGKLPKKPEGADQEEWDDDWAGCLEELLTGVGVGFHCSFEYPTYFLCIAEISAYRGYPKRVAIEGLVVTPKKRELLVQALKLLGMESEAENIGWWLASYTD